MSPHTYADPVMDPATDPGQPRRVSRRSVLRGAAGAGAVGLAAAAGAGAVVAASPGTKAAAPTATDAGPAKAGPLVVYLRDATTGELEVFAGTSKVRFRDPALAARLARAVR